MATSKTRPLARSLRISIPRHCRAELCSTGNLIAELAGQEMPATVSKALKYDQKLRFATDYFRRGISCKNHWYAVTSCPSKILGKRINSHYGGARASLRPRLGYRRRRDSRNDALWNVRSGKKSGHRHLAWRLPNMTHSGRSLPDTSQNACRAKVPRIYIRFSSLLRDTTWYVSSLPAEAFRPWASVAESVIAPAC
jgi:hypothetical protein